METGETKQERREKKLENELTTQEGKQLIDQICQVSSPLLILSGGEPLLRPDIYELINYGSKKGLKMGLGSNGSLIDQEAAKKLKDAGIATVSISLDSHIPKQHDDQTQHYGSDSDERHHFPNLCYFHSK